jgi:flagellar biosynthetic protein FliO
MNMLDRSRFTRGIRRIAAGAFMLGIYSGAIAAPSDTAPVWDSARIAKVNELAQTGTTFTGTTDSAAKEASVRALRKPQETLGVVVLKITVALGIVILLLFGITWAAKRFGLAGGSKIGGGGSMDLLEVLPLGQNRTIMLIRVMDKVYLIGQTADSIVNLEVFEGEKALEIVSASKGGSTMMQFKDVFNNFMGRTKKSA